MILKLKYNWLTTAGLILVLSASQGWAQKPKYPVPEAKYEVRVERSHMIPMRDGVRLSTDLYFPVGAGEKLPVIVIRTPYNKERFYENQWFGSYFFSGQGFVVAVQDCRGKFESEGDYTYIVADTDDGFDMVNWAR